MNHGDVIDVHAEFVCGNLRERRLLSLPMRRGACENRYLAGRFDSDGCALPPACGHRLRWTKRANLNIARQSNADQSAFSTGLLLFFAQFSITGKIKCLVQSGFVIAAVVFQTRGRVKRELISRRKVFASNFYRIDLQFRGDDIHRAFDDISSLGPAGPAISVC